MAFSSVGCVCGVPDGKEKKGVQVPESAHGGGRGRVCIMGVGCPRDVYKTHKTKHDYMSQARGTSIRESLRRRGKSVHNWGFSEGCLQNA